MRHMAMRNKRQIYTTRQKFVHPCSYKVFILYYFRSNTTWNQEVTKKNAKMFSIFHF